MNKTLNLVNKDYFTNIASYVNNLKIIEALFQQWGYKAVLIPLMDMATYYSHIDSSQEKPLKTLATNNELMFLRSDSTLFLSKILGTHLHKDLLPLRLYYSNSVLQSTVQHDVEHWQSGVELIGVASPTAEFEIISLLYKTMDSIINDFYIHIGSQKLLTELLKHNSRNIATQDYANIFDNIIKRNIEYLKPILDPIIIDIIFTIADEAIYPLWKKNIQSVLDTSNNALIYFSSYFEALLTIDNDKRFCCDLSELGTHDYYSNTIYTVYSPTLTTPLAKGGRYDSLLKMYGYDTSAIGFTISPYLVIDELIQKNKNPSKSVKNPFSHLYNSGIPTSEDLVSCYKKITM